MRIMLRKIYIWLISLALVVIVYLVINLISQREPIYFEKGSNLDDFNSVGKFESEIGKIGEVSITDMQGSTYQHRNENGDVDREVGFERPIRAVGERWEIEEPFINFYRKDLSCYITADRGVFEVETVVKQPVPKDGSLNGNVVVHIVPLISGEIQETFIYLDDIEFDGERSLAETEGPIKIVSENVQLTGRGLKFVYNEESGGLEYLKIIDLDKMILKVSSDLSLFDTNESSIEEPGFVKEEERKGIRDEKVISEEQGIIISADSNGAAADGKLYRWVLSENVVIDCPEQIIFADQLFINNIFIREGSGGQGKEDIASSDVNEAVVSEDAGAGDISADAIEPNEPQEGFMEIVVSCDGGILVTGMDSNIVPEPAAAEATVTGGMGLARYGDPNDRATLEARRIDYCALSDVALLQGDCLATMVKGFGDIDRKYSLSAPRIRAEMSEQEKRKSSAMAAGLEHLIADGGQVVLAVRKLEGKDLLGFTKLSCLRFDYEAGRQMCWATGPGRIDIDNSKMSRGEIEGFEEKENEGADKFSLRKPCYALVQNFEILEYYLDSEQIAADAGSESIHIGYLPVVDGEEGRVVKVSVGHLDGQLKETERGRTELLSLHASKGVTYEEEGKKDIWGRKRSINLVGSDLFYDREEALITVWGDEGWPCTLNGISVDGIKYNLETGKLEEARVLGPGIVW